MPKSTSRPTTVQVAISILFATTIFSVVDESVYSFRVYASRDGLAFVLGRVFVIWAIHTIFAFFLYKTWQGFIWARVTVVGLMASSALFHGFVYLGSLRMHMGTPELIIFYISLRTLAVVLLFAAPRDFWRSGDAA